MSLKAAKNGFQGVPFCIDQKRRRCFVFRSLRRFLPVFVYRTEMPGNASLIAGLFYLRAGRVHWQFPATA